LIIGFLDAWLSGLIKFLRNLEISDELMEFLEGFGWEKIAQKSSRVDERFTQNPTV
jgi:hypothetical protein